MLLVEQQAKEYGFIDFEGYLTNEVAGWPCYPRSTGRFRGATRLRQFFEQRQQELPLAKEQADALRQQLTVQPAIRTDAYRPQYHPNVPAQEAQIVNAGAPTAADQPTTLFQRLLKRMRGMFH